MKDKPANIKAARMLHDIQFGHGLAQAMVKSGVKDAVELAELAKINHDLKKKLSIRFMGWDKGVPAAKSKTGSANPTEREALIAEAKELGIEYPEIGNVSVDKLKSDIEAARANEQK
jgi:hypothetical protein